MRTLVIPSRHIIYSKEQENRLMDHLRSHSYDRIVLAITSYNLNNCKYSPVDLVGRLCMVNRLVQQIQSIHAIPCTISIIPHYPTRTQFAQHVITHSIYQLDISMNTEDTEIFAFGSYLAQEFTQAGYITYYMPTPDHITLFKILYEEKDEDRFWNSVGDAARRTLENQTDILPKVQKVWTDPILTDTGGLTDTRNYHTYAYDMSNESMLAIKFNDIKHYIREGTIVDEGCADAALFIPLSKEFPDSTLIGVDISEEFIARAQERLRAGFFGKSFVTIVQGNILKPLFKSGSIDTTICNSTTHEIWSYNNKRESLDQYLQYKRDQLVDGGRIVIRDVIGPKNPHQSVYICDTSSPETLERFITDFRHTRPQDIAGFVEHNGTRFLKTNLKWASEYLLHKDYIENWESEMCEEFCHINSEDWGEILLNNTFKIVSISSYRSEWIIEHRVKNKIMLLDENFAPLPFPDTNCVVVGEK